MCMYVGDNQKKEANKGNQEMFLVFSPKDDV